MTIRDIFIYFFKRELRLFRIWIDRIFFYKYPTNQLLKNNYSKDPKSKKNNVKPVDKPLMNQPE